ncbi:hypothetical protein KKF86_09450 [bacterium]|nr:hypothetical protein [bacterium]
MLLARYAPVGSQRYEKLAQSVKSIDKIMEWIPAQLFGIWTMFVAGIASGKAQTDRFYFWDWSDWLVGMVGILVITLIFYPLKKKLKIKELNQINWMKNSKSYLYYLIVGIILFSVGWYIANNTNFNNMYNAFLSYMVFFGSIMFVYPTKIEGNYIYDIKHKNINTIFGILFLICAIFMGFVEDDPVIATASIVSLPFLLVLLFGKHIRHLERAKFYPIFIFAMFVVSREGWFLIPLLLLFFILRSYNYLRYQKVYPTFGVTDDRS